MPYFTNRGITPLPAAPSGVQGWDIANKTANITISGSDLIATCTGTSDGGVRGLVGKSSGKVYWEVVITTNPGSAAFGAAICDSLYMLGTTIDGTKKAWLIFNDNQIYESNGGGAVGSTSVSFATGGILGIAADLTTQRMWTTNALTSDWLGAAGDPTPSPITPSGGINIAGTAGTSTPPFYPFLDMRTSGVVMTGNFTGSYSCPSAGAAASAGYGNWI